VIRAESTDAAPDGVSRPLSEIKAELFKALGHPGRVRILEVLADGEHSVTELLTLVGLEASHLSQQLGVLRRAGVVTARRDGSTVRYAVASDEVVELLAVAKRFLLDGLRARQELLAVVDASSVDVRRRT
jgi:ArsR family transcriptional regulator